MTDYDHTTIESTWQQRWEESGLYRARVDWSRPKHYALTMLPYPSGDLHIGHWYSMTPPDARARYMRMKGYNVLFPMGFDAFGLPAENAAVQRNIHPATWTKTRVEYMRGQMKSMGTMIDWEREIVSCEPEYYRWTQWLFKQLYEHGLAYRGEALVNWSPTLQTVLANEQVIDGKDERTGQPVVQKLMEQWFFPITRYADELLRFDGIDWPEPVRAMQTNWIGRSEGAEVVFPTPVGDGHPHLHHAPRHVVGGDLHGARPRAPAGGRPHHGRPAPSRSTPTSSRRRAKTELERMEESKVKTGVFTGGYATNPVNGEEIPVWVADYVLLSYGTGAIMAVPAHDQRDFEFARQFGLPVVPVIDPAAGDLVPGDEMVESYVGPGVMMGSGPIDGVETTTAKGRANPSIAATIDWLEEQGIGSESINYRLRDWLISRQRYWGAPIPIVYPDDGGVESVADEDLPVAPAGGRRLRRDQPARDPPAVLRDRRCRGPPGPARDRHPGHLHVLVVVLVPLPVTALRRGAVRPRGGRLLAPGGQLHRWGGARRHAPALRTVLRQGDARHGSRSTPPRWRCRSTAATRSTCSTSRSWHCATRGRCSARSAPATAS